jgi:hypothetical protein
VIDTTTKENTMTTEDEEYEDIPGIDPRLLDPDEDDEEDEDDE